METLSLKTLANKILQRNSHGNKRETIEFSRGNIDGNTVMETMKRKYSDLILWLQGYPVIGDDILDGATWLYVRIQDTIRILDACMIAEDLQGFDRAIEKLKSQYLEAVNRLINW